MNDTTPFARQYPHLTGPELASRLRDLAVHPSRYGQGDIAVLLDVAASRFDAAAEARATEVARRIARTMAPPAPDVTMNNGYIVRAVMPGHPAEPGLLASWWVACQESMSGSQWVTWEAYALDGDRAGQLAYNAGQYFYSTDPAANKRNALANLAVRAGIR